ncbi:MAG: bifunctional nuclease [Fibrobacteres bacterium]|nr:bifunctional nuclease [Fibrobacterota bacterium]
MDEEPEERFDLNEEDFLEAGIDNISVSNLGFIVFLKADGDNRVLPIFIGANEAQSIAIAYNNQVPPRPLTHDLMKNVLGMLDVEVTKVQVTSLTENTFFGRVYFKREGIEDLDIDARPSDAIALALRYKAPIFVHKDVYESAAIVVKETGEGEGVLSEVESGEEAEPETHISQVERLKDNLRRALAAEHYEEAAKIRDELKRFESGN